MTKGWVDHRIGDFRLTNEWEVAQGSILVLFGPSGAGKTMTLRCIAGLVRPLRGHIEVDGSTVFDHESGAWLPPHLRRVGYVPQEYHLFPHLDVVGNIAYGLKDGIADHKRERVAELVKSLRLDGLESRKVSELSGGQQQRVALARALAPQPQVLLLDEPFAALDLELRHALHHELRAVLKEWGIPVVLVTHDKEDALALGDSVLVIDHGRRIAHGEPLAVLDHPGESRIAHLVGVENLLHFSVKQVNPKDGIMTCTGSGVDLEAPMVDASTGQKVTLGIRAREIILAISQPVGLSARNILPGKVLSTTPRGAEIEVTVDCGVELRCLIARRAMLDLDICPGKQVWAIIKASSIFVVND